MWELSAILHMHDWSYLLNSCQPHDVLRFDKDVKTLMEENYNIPNLTLKICEDLL